MICHFRKAGGLDCFLGSRSTSSQRVAWTCLVHGLLYFLPLLLTTLFVAVFWEGVFAIVRRRAMDEGFVLTCLLFTLTLPPGLPLWQAAVGISFGVVVAKQVFGGTGNNFLNPALAGRAFLYFAYPAEISGNGRWIAVDGHTSATSLTLAGDDGLAGIAQSGISWSDALLGAVPGSLGETSILACLFGAVILLVLRLASWRIMLGQPAWDDCCLPHFQLHWPCTKPTVGGAMALAPRTGRFCLWHRLHGH